MSRIAATFEKLQAKGRKALIPFITCGDPSPQDTLPLMHTLVRAGANILELGVPFSDPMADGPTIQRASERALKYGVGLKDVLATVAEFRKTDATTPVVLMGYANPIEAMGWDRFASRAAEAGVDGVLTVDYPPEECGEFVSKLAEKNLDAIFLLAPTTPAARRAEVLKLARGFVYYVSLKGVTGAAHLDTEEVERNIASIRAQSKVPVGAGFGIRDAETARAMARFADAVIIGSRIVQEIEQSQANNMLSNVTTLVAGIRSAMDQK